MLNIVPRDYSPSGLYVCHPTLIATVSLANPFYEGKQPFSITEFEDGSAAEGLLQHLRQERDCFILNQHQVHNYGQSVVKMARQIKESRYQAVLCPLRGSRMPSAQVATMCESAEHFHAFDFSYGAQGYNDDRVVGDLCQIITDYGSPPRIAVLDTAKGGQGSAKLAELLDSRVFSELGYRCGVDFHLMHEGQRRPEKSIQIFRYSDFGVNYHPVQSLLFEDESKLLGYETIREDSTSQIHPLSAPGRIAVVGDGSVKVYSTDSLDAAAIGIIGGEIRFVLDTLPDVKLTDPNYWQHRMVR